MFKRNLIMACLIFFIVLSANFAWSDNFRDKGTIFGFKVGLVSPGSIDIEDFSEDGDMSYSLGGFVDYALAEKIYGGISLDLHNMSVYDESKIMYDISGTLKAKIFSETSNLTFRPGIAIGYGGIPGFEAEGEDIDASSYFVVKGMVEMIIQSGDGLAWLAELAIIAGPSGGNDDYDITFGPGFLLRGGLVF